MDQRVKALKHAVNKESKQLHHSKRQRQLSLVCFVLVLLTLVGAVCVSLITVVSTVIVAIAGPVFWDAAATVAFELDTGT